MHRFAVGVAVALVVATPGARAAPAAFPKPITLLTTKGSLDAFGQDGSWITWIDSYQRCSRIVQIKNLETHKTLPLLRPGSPTCDAVENLGAFEDTIALAGRRALWGYVNVSNTVYDTDLFTAAPGSRERRLRGVEVVGGLEEDAGTARAVPISGDRGTLVYADISETGSRPERGVIRVTARSASTIPGTEHTRLVAAFAQRLALVRAIPQEPPAEDVLTTRTTVVDVRHVPTGAVQSSFALGERTVDAVAFDGERIALLFRGAATVVEIRDLAGGLVSALPVPASTVGLGLSGRWLVYSVGRSIRVTDLRSGATAVVLTPKAYPFALSVEGRRAAWAESRRNGPDVIRAIVLPR
jgi:hypothetical protein